ncbi:flagellar hook-basal body complex protein FliE [Pacificimonas sp. WHA3]|uniref:Flagellar hook-basal body complex protein FliE n=1 Tax=Pacificimonas pallii TaxID=2827236 RepID=A0ABS6SF26_9SPHN|nr:flagellar hook-basal body complex protein FliE [Pacificimonas pallii]MBV7257004.1 flagellar hook-basal body complex protein FliE [Pacificimonas pallii]
MKVDPSKLMSIRADVLARNNALAAASANKTSPGADDAGFGKIISSAVDNVAALQAESSKAVSAFQSGESHDVASMMVARQKSSLGFQATLQIRNKLLSAYKDIMNMPV